MDAGDGGDAETQLLHARETQDDLEALRMRASVQQALFGESPEPIKIGRHVILDKLGAGGVGTVYAAYDPELNRRVALKVLRPHSGFGSSSSADARTRLRREAQAMAQLNHPNVITVYEVGEIGSEVYISMELVDGENLAQWIRRGPHPWRDVVSRFAQAGRGLAAAHRVGLVHRDFKPSNVLAGTDGRVRVLDFGLAKLAGVRADAVPEDHSGSHLGDDSITYAGAVVGTPAYMAPEQHTGAGVEARSDQYSFCVALFEGLYGQRPFKGPDLEDLAEQKTAGDVTPRERATAAKVPAHLERAVLRGLRADPDQRHRSMDALVEALESDPITRRRRWFAGAGVVAALMAVTTLWAAYARSAPSCDDVDTRLEGIWDDEQRARIRAAFESTNLRYAHASFERVERALDDYTHAWVAERTAACETRLGDRSADVIAREVCLDSRLLELAQFTELLASADATVVQNGVDAVQALPSIESCEASLVDEDANDQRRRGALERDLTRAVTLRAAGKFQAAKEAATRLREDAVQVGAGRIERRAMLLRARLLDDLGDPRAAETALLDVIAAAEVAGDEEMSIEAELELVFVLGVGVGQPDAGLRWARLAEAHIERAGDVRQLAQLHNHRGLLLKDLGDYEQATQELRHSLQLRERLGDTNAISSSLNNLGILLLERDEHEAARDHFRRAYDLTRELRGDEHPDLVNPLANLGTAYMKLERWDEAERTVEEAIELIEVTLGPEHASLTLAYANLGTIHRGKDDDDRALKAYARALDIAVDTLGETHPSVGITQVNVAQILLERGQIDEARARHTKASTILERSFGAEHPKVVEMRREWEASLAAAKVTP